VARLWFEATKTWTSGGPGKWVPNSFAKNLHEGTLQEGASGPGGARLGTLGVEDARLVVSIEDPDALRRTANTDGLRCCPTEQGHQERPHNSTFKAK